MDLKVSINANRLKWYDYYSELESTYIEYAEQRMLSELQIFSPTDIPGFELINEKVKDNTLKKTIYNDLRKKLFNQFIIPKNYYGNDICPLCEGVMNSIPTLEHIIPKSSEPYLAIVPSNLIPACRECNTSSHWKRETELSEIHLYFEEYCIEKLFGIKFKIENRNSRWLVPELIITNKNESGIDDLDFSRIKRFIEVYKLEQTYNYRINQVFNRILRKIADQGIYLIKKETLINFLTNEIKIYEGYIELERINNNTWINDNFFGKLICEGLIQLIKTSSSKTTMLSNCLSSLQLNFESLVMENFDKVSDFQEKLFNTQNIVTLDDFINHLIGIYSEHTNDFINYYLHINRISKDVVFYHIEVPKGILNDKELPVFKELFYYYLLSDKNFFEFFDKYRQLIE